VDGRSLKCAVYSKTKKYLGFCYVDGDSLKNPSLRVVKPVQISHNRLDLDDALIASFETVDFEFDTVTDGLSEWLILRCKNDGDEKYLPKFKGLG
jgi:hypothetical protein